MNLKVSLSLLLVAMASGAAPESNQGDLTKLQGRIKAGECVRVVGTRGSPGRQWAEVEPSLCQ